MTPQFKIDILLSTYNGELYLSDLLESIINQSFTDWRLIIRDDGSQDKTLDILYGYCGRYPNKIVLIPPQGGNLGPKLSFGQLLECSTASYVMFCDQDDVWLKEKIQVSFDKVLELEQEFGNNMPVLVYTDSFLTDKELNVISNSALHYIGYDNPQATKFRNLILRNVMTGNTLIFNKNLRKLSCPIPKNAFMHDWWVAIVASAFGFIGYVKNPTVFYRQHDENVCGYRKPKYFEMLLDFDNEYKKYYHHQDRVMGQIKVFYERLDSFLEGVQAPKEVLMALPFASLEKLDYWKRKFFLFSFYKECIYRGKAFFDLMLYFKIYK